MPAYFDTHAHYFDRKFAELPGGASALLHDPDFRRTVSGIINSLIYGGSAISIYAFGAIAEYIGWNIATAIWLGLALVSALILAFAIKPWQQFLQKEAS